MANNLTSIWSKKDYYQKIASWDKLDHPGLQEIFKDTKDATSILDVGAGDGTKLSHMGSATSEKTGTEVTKQAVQIAKKKHPKFHFVQSFGEKLPFTDNSFDAVTCLFVLEHTENPEKVVSEIIRVTKVGGNFYLLAPNYGAPNRASPNFKGSRWKKLIDGFIADFTNSTSLNWHQVSPTISSISEFESDLDTTVEPYLGSLIKYLKAKNIKIIKSSSFWEMELPNASPIQKVFRLFESNWGPHLFVIGQKQ